MCNGLINRLFKRALDGRRAVKEVGVMADPKDKPETTVQSPQGRCPICRAPTQQAARPFCSRACADVDLSRWLRGAYVIEGASADDDEDGDNADAPLQAEPPEPEPPEPSAKTPRKSPRRH